MKAVEGLPQKQKSLWTEALKRFPLHQGPGKWDGSIDGKHVGQLTGACDVALVDDALAEVDFGFDDEELSRPNVLSTGVEVCRFIAANKAIAFKTASAISGCHIQQGEAYESIWRSRFRMLAIAGLKRIVIVDRYAVSQHFECAAAQLSGLERFLRLLAQDGTGTKHVTLFSAWTAELRGKYIEDVEGELRAVMSRLPTKVVKRLKVVMIQNASFGDLAHDRFIRFEDYVWELGLGIRIFEGPTCSERSSAAFKAGLATDGHKQVEADLGGNPAAKSKEIFC